jgi:CheY-like chemotaxis protein
MSSDTAQSLRIILIEDEPSLVSLYSFGLKKLGEVHSASTKLDAIHLLEQAAAEQQKVDVILLDLILPGDHTLAVKYSDRVGFEVLEWIRQQKYYELVPVIVMTNLDSGEDRRLAEQLGANGYIVKSNVVPRQIIEEIKAVL